jgi:hypothetical protein
MRRKGLSESLGCGFDWVGGVGIFLVNEAQSFFSCLALSGERRIKHSSSKEKVNPKPMKINVFIAMTPVFISQMTRSQNGIQIIPAHMIAAPGIE